MDTEGGISNIDISDIVMMLHQKYPWIMNKFRGVYPADQIRDVVLNENETVIINLSRSYEIGTHFVAAAKQNGQYIYFDSLGLLLKQPDIHHFLVQLRKNVLYDRIQIQPFDSQLCGFYCMLFIFTVHFCSANDFFSFFNLQNLQNNDYFVIELLLKFVAFEGV